MSNLINICDLGGSPLRHRLLGRIWEGRGRKGNPGFFKSKLGNPLSKGEDDQGKYVVYKMNETTFHVYKDYLEVFIPEEYDGSVHDDIVRLDEALGVSDRPIPLDEELKWKEFGRETCRGHEKQIPRMEQAELRKFVVDVLAGQIFTDKQLRSANDASMVFAILAFGGLDPYGPDEEKGREGDSAWFARQKLPSPWDEPEMPEEPVWEEPDKLKYARKPEKPDAMEPDYSALPDPTWDFMEGEDPHASLREAAQKVAQRKTDARMVEWQREVDDWEKGCRELDQQWEAEYQIAKAKHDEEMAEWGAECDSLENRHAEWEREHAISNAAYQGFGEQYLKDLGCIYEHMSKAGPRGINGYPMFMSCHLMHKEDWERALKAILREQKRQEGLEV